MSFERVITLVSILLLTGCAGLHNQFGGRFDPDDWLEVRATQVSMIEDASRTHLIQVTANQSDTSIYLIKATDCMNLGPNWLMQNLEEYRIRGEQPVEIAAPGVAHVLVGEVRGRIRGATFFVPTSDGQEYSVEPGVFSFSFSQARGTLDDLEAGVENRRWPTATWSNAYVAACSLESSPLLIEYGIEMKCGNHPVKHVTDTREEREILSRSPPGCRDWSVSGVATIEDFRANSFPWFRLQPNELE